MGKAEGNVLVCLINLRVLFLNYVNESVYVSRDKLQHCWCFLQLLIVSGFVQYGREIFKER